MADAYHHALSSKRKFGGEVEDYIAIHQWFDNSKYGFADQRHRAVKHHAEGIAWCVEWFGMFIRNSDGKEIPVRYIAEQHVREDLSWIPSISDWFKNMTFQPWMRTGVMKEVTHLQSRDVARGESGSSEGRTGDTAPPVVQDRNEDALSEDSPSSEGETQPDSHIEHRYGPAGATAPRFHGPEDDIPPVGRPISGGSAAIQQFARIPNSPTPENPV